MDIKKIKQKRKKLITELNPEWQNILDLRSDVQKDFHNNEFLSIATYYKILDWKLDKQKSRIEKIKSSSSDALIKNVTQCYCRLEHSDNDMTTRIKIHSLLTIHWIGIGIASTIMALHKPQLYASIDSRSWLALFEKNKTNFSMNDYLKYLSDICELADKLKCDVQEMDYILWHSA